MEEEGAARGARGGDVDDRVPEAHEGEDDAGGVGVGDGDGLGVDERVDAVDGRGHPGDEQGDEEQRGHFGVAKGRPVGFHGRLVPLRLLLLLLLLLVFGTGVVRERGAGRRGDFDVVFGVAGVGRRAGRARIAVGFAVRRGNAGVGDFAQGEVFEFARDLVVGGLEGVVVVLGGVVERAQLVTFLENLPAGHDVDCKGGDDAYPGRNIRQRTRVSSTICLIHVPGWTVTHGDTQEIPIMG